MNELGVMRLRKRCCGLLEEVNDAFLGLRAIHLDDLVERCALEKLHGVIEDSVGRASVVVDRYGVGMRELRGALDLALEPSQGVFSGPVGQEQLDGGGPPEHRM